MMPGEEWETPEPPEPIPHVILPRLGNSIRWPERHLEPFGELHHEPWLYTSPGMLLEFGVPSRPRCRVCRLLDRLHLRRVRRKHWARAHDPLRHLPRVSTWTGPPR